MNRLLPTLAALCFYFASCANQPAVVAKTDSDSIITARPQPRADTHHTCCFQNTDQFGQFFPSSFDEISQVTSGVHVALNCSDDTTMKSFAWKEYGVFVEQFKITLTDFSNDTSALAQYYDQSVIQYRDDKSGHEFNEIDVPGIYHGFIYYTAKAKKLYILMNVDHRFMYEITSDNALSTKNALKIMNRLPVASLVTFCR